MRHSRLPSHDVLHAVVRRELEEALGLGGIADRLMRAAEAHEERTHELHRARVHLRMSEREEVPAQGLVGIGLEMGDLGRGQEQPAGIVDATLELGLGAFKAELSCTAIKIHARTYPLSRRSRFRPGPTR
jgi:hypothetical protein